MTLTLNLYYESEWLRLNLFKASPTKCCCSSAGNLYRPTFPFHNMTILLSTMIHVYTLGTSRRMNVVKGQLVMIKRLQIYFLSVSDTFHPRRDMTRQDKKEYRRANDQNRTRTSFHLFLHKRLTSCLDILSMRTAAPELYFPWQYHSEAGMCPSLLMYQTRLQLSTFFRIHSS